MKTSKAYSDLARYYYRPELTTCLACGSSLKRSHTAWEKTISSLSGTAHIYNQAYRCGEHEACGQPQRVYRSAYADGLSLPYYTYGLDVIVAIGQQRLREHRTIPEIHGYLSASPYLLRISEREVEYLFDTYLLLLACSHGERLAGYRAQIEANQGLVLAIDGAKPEKGHPGLFIFRDALTGCRLHAALLYSADAQSLAAELQVVKALGLPIQAVISDDEAATCKAVSQELPEVLHGLCHIHFLKAVQEPIRQADSQLASQLKSPLRAITQVERTLQHDSSLVAELSAHQQTALTRYLDTLRAVTFTKGQAPFRLAGVPMYEALEQIHTSLRSAHLLQSHPILTQLLRMTHSYIDHLPTYQRLTRQQGWFYGLADLLDVPTVAPFHGSTQTGAEVAQAVADYLDELSLLHEALPEDALLFRHFQIRSEAWAPGLYWTYELPALPRTNNDLEVDIGNLKEQYRRITGRRCLKDYLMRYGPYLAFDHDQDDLDELLRWFQHVDQQSFKTEREKLNAIREHLRNMHRFRQDPHAFLAETERLWRDPD
jgi:hypothetical protein